jgi:molybdopterin-guanine dinucleotide biosynthesis protein A
MAVMEGVRGEVAGIVLVGGKSRRMGTDKALLPLKGEPLVELVAGAVGAVVARVLLVGGPAERFAGMGLPVVEDVYPGSSLGGLYTGLLRAETPHVLAVACDMPFPNRVLMRHLVSLREGHDVVVPRRGRFLEPLCAVYSRECLPHMREMLEAGNFRIDDFYGRVRVRHVEGRELEALDAGGSAFVNVNTPDEYRRILEGDEG